MKNEAKLVKWGVDKSVKYYYLKFGEGAEDVPDGFLGVATVCIIPAGADPVGVFYVRGVAFCSPDDQFVKKTGRAIALGRAIKALERKEDSDFIPKNTPAGILNRQGWHYLSAWHVSLAVGEEGLFRCSGKS
ncbi:MAG: hypothetical protein PHI12_06835 [Dehalococcoidales bacterium]|nr:hypothetical protein [Dehalococcoidales bacterium]